MRESSAERALVIALLASLVLWHLPFGGIVLYPFKLFATWLHEMSHGLTMIVVGAGFESLEIYGDTSGIARGSHRVGPEARAIIANAGYIGTATFGAFIVVVGRTPTRARQTLLVIGAALLASAALWIVGDFAIAAVAVAGASLIVFAAVAPGRMSLFAAHLIAAQSCANAILDIRVLFRQNLLVGGRTIPSDAQTMANSTFGPPSLWAVLWLLGSLGAFFFALRYIHQRQVVTERPGDSD